MGAWGFVALAYGIVWTTLVIYWLTLRKRKSKAEAKLFQLASTRRTERNA